MVVASPISLRSASSTFQPGPFDFAAYATGAGCGAITLSGNTSTDSFDSSKGTYAQTKQLSGGNVGTTGNTSLNGNVTINGFIAALNKNVGTCKNGSPGISITGKSAATGGYIQLSTVPAFADPPVVTPGPQDYHFTANASLLPGSYGNIALSGHSTLTLAAGTYNINSITLSGQSVLQLNSPGQVIINVAGNNVSQPIQFSGGSIDNPSGTARNFQLIYGGNLPIAISGGSTSYAVLYAPHAAAALSGDSDWFGSLVVGTLNDSGGAAIHYDRSLASLPTILAAVSPPPNAAGWNKSNVIISFTCSDPVFAITSCTSPVQLATEGANQVVTGTAVNQAGSAATASVTVSIDKTLPVLSGLAAPPPNAAGWNNSNVTVSFACSDNLSGIASCPTPVTVSGEAAGQIVAGTAVDKAGNSATAATTVSLDKTPPMISAVITPSPNATGWNNSNVTVTFTCSDALSGVSACPAPVQVTTEGAGQVISGTATDKAGNSASISVTINIDKTAPKITATATPVPNAAGWNNTDITVTFTCVDGGSGVDVCPAPVQVTTDGANQVISGTARDKAGNTATASVSVSLDKTSPTLSGSLAPSPNANGWESAAVVVTFSCADSVSGVVVCPSPVTVSTEGANQAVSGTATDKAGNTASTSVSVDLDRTPPAISAAATPAPNPAGWNNSNVTVGFNCTDTLSGIASCSSPVQVAVDGAQQAISGTAVDKAGNTASTAATINLDKTPPTITATITPAPNAAGWNNANATVTFTCTDVTSGIDSCPAPVPAATEGANQAITGTAKDKAGNTAQATATVNLDKTPPTIAIASPLNGAALPLPSVTVNGTVGDLLSGVASVTCQGVAATLSGSNFSCVVAIVAGANSITMQATDIAGNSAQASLSIQGGVPTLLSISPTAAQQGQAGISITITGQYTHFTNASMIDVGAGIAVGGVVATDATHLTAQLDIAAGGTVSTRSLTVTTGAEVVTLANAFAVTNGTPVLTAVNPHAGQQGQQNENVNLTGQFTHWVQGTTTASFGPGISVLSITVNSPTSATAALGIDPAAATGARDVTFSTGAEVVTLTNGFTVTAGTPVLLTVNPNTGRPGQQNLAAVIVGQYTHFVQGTTIASFGAGVTVVSLTVNSTTDATAVLNIDQAAATGARNVTLTTGTEVATLADAFFTIAPNTVMYVVNSFGSVPSTISAYSLNPTTGGLSPIAGSPFPSLPAGYGYCLAADPSARFLYMSLEAGSTASNVAAYTINASTGTLSPIPGSPFSAGINPVCLTVDPTGRFVFLVDRNSSKVAALAINGATGALSPVPGSPFEAGATGFYSVVVEPRGQFVYFASNGANGGPTHGTGPIAAFVINQTSGTLTPVPGSPFSAGINLGSITIDPSGRFLYAGDDELGQQGQILGFTIQPTSGAIVPIPGSPWKNSFPVESIAIHPSGRFLYGANVYGHNQLLAYSIDATTGALTSLAGSPYQLGTVAFRLAIDPTGRFLYASTYSDNELLAFAVDGTTGALTQIPGSPYSSLSPLGLAVVKISPSPQIMLVNPNTGHQGQTNLSVTITGQFTHFSSASVVTFSGTGITAGMPTAATATSLTLPVSIAANAPLGAQGIQVVTGAETVTLVNGFTVTAGTPVITLVNPNSGQQGQQNLSVAIAGQYTHFLQGTTTAIFGVGITVASLTINSTTSATAMLNIDPAAATGARDVTVTTGVEVLTLAGGYTVTAGTPLITLNPNTGQQGQVVNVTIAGQYTHFAQGSSEVNFGLDIIVNSVTVASITELIAKITIPLEAPAGVRSVSVTTGQEVVSLANGFAVSPPCLSGKENGVRVTYGASGSADSALAAHPNVIKLPTGSVRMYYVGCDSAGVCRILSAVSVDGLSWTKEPGVRVDAGPGEITLLEPNVLQLSDGSLRMYYSSQQSNGTMRIVSAVSVDGITWNKEPGTRIDVGGVFGCFDVRAPKTLRIQGGMLRMYYWCVQNSATQFGIILSATSIDGISWTAESGSRLASASGALYREVAVHELPGGQQRMYFGEQDSFPIGSNPGFIRSAVSSDWLTWTIEPGVRVDHGPPGSPDELFALTPDLFDLGDGTFRLYYNGGPLQVSGTSERDQILSARVCSLELNNPPTVTAGANQTIVLPLNSVSLNGTASDDGLPQGATLTVLWSVLSGPGPVSFADATALSTTASFTSVGTYTLRLTVSDSQLVSKDDLQVTVNSPVSPILTSVSPSAGHQGQQNLSVTITGQFTHWVQGTTTADFGAGITVATLTINSATSATAVLNINPAAALGSRTVTVTTGTEVASLSGGFVVSAAVNQVPTASAGSNQTVTLASDLFVAGENTSDVLRFNGTTGALIGVFVPAASGGLNLDADMVTGPDGNLYVTSQTPLASTLSKGAVLRYDGITGSFIDAFVALGGGGLRAPTALIFGPDGNLYVSDFVDQNVKRYNGTTGAFLGIFTSGGSPLAPQGLRFGPDGNLYLADELQVLRYNGSTGAYMGIFVPALSGGLQTPQAIEFGPDGNLYVSDTAGHAVRRYAGATGAFVDSFVASGSGGLNLAAGIAFGPDGNLYVGDQAGGQILRYDGGTGSFLNVFVPAGTGGLTGSSLALAYIHFQSVASLVLNGSFSDDGLPRGSTLTATWSQISGPGPVKFGSPTFSAANVARQTNPASTSAGFTIAGTYQLQLSVSDSQLTSTSTVTVTVNPPGPSLVSASPNTGQQGQQNLSISIIGQNTHFAQGTTTASFGAGITVASLTVYSATSATVVLNIDPAAATGARSVTLTTGVEVATVATAFSVAAGTPVITLVNPNTGQQGQSNLSVTITGQFTHFSSASFVTFSGSGVTAGLPSAATATSLTLPVAIAANAPLGAQGIQVVTGAETVSLANAFTVTAGTPILTTVNPNTGQQGQQNLVIGLTGQFTHWVQGSTTASLGDGIAVGGAAAGASGPITVNSATSATAQVAIWNRPNWTQLSPTGQAPAKRMYNTLVYDHADNLAILFGGTDFSTNYNDVWRLTNADGQGSSKWSQVAIQGSSPSPRAMSFAFYDSSTDTMTVYGGFLGDYSPCTSELWSLSNASGRSGGSSWTQLNPAGPAPSPRFGNTAVYDSSSNRMIIMGGHSCPGTAGYSDIWVLSNANGVGGTPTWTQMSPSGPSPGIRHYGAAVYDSSNNRMMLFGGKWNPDIGLISSGDLWVLTNANGLGGPPTWSQLTPLGFVFTDSVVGAAVYDPVTNRMLVFTAGPNDADTLVLNNANGLGGQPAWIRLGPFQTLPGPRYNGPPGSVYDSISDRFITFGGEQTNFYPYYGVSMINDTWVLGAAIRSAVIGPRTVTVQTGPEIVSASDGFSILPSSSVPSVMLAPAYGPIGGNLAVTITGENTAFAQGATQASFGPGISVGGGPLGGFGPVTVIGPAAAVAQVSIATSAPSIVETVTISTGATTVSPANGFLVANFTYPLILSVNPNSGSVGQPPLAVTINSSNTHFSQATTQVDFGSGISVGAISVTSPTSLTAQISIAANASLGFRTVTVTTGSEVTALANGFTVVAAVSPQITNISPNSGPQGQGGPMTIVGLNTHFVQGTSVLDLGPGITVSSVTVTCLTCLSAQVAISDTAATGPRNVTVTTGTEVATLANGFTVQPGTPIVISEVPASGRQGQSLAVAFTGKFTHWVQGTTQVSLGAGITVTSVAVANATSLTAQVSIDAAATLGTRTPVITTGTEVVSVADIFSVQSGITTVTPAPASGQQAQTLPVTITGQFTHFAQGSSVVDFGAGITVGTVTVASTTSLAAQITIAENAATGPRTVTVTTGTEIVTAPNAFAVNLGTIILSLNPGGAYQNQTVSVAITGQLTNFAQGVTQVIFGPGIAVGGAAEGGFGPVTVTGPTAATAQIVVNTAATPGPRMVRAQTGTEIASFTNGFSVLAPFIINSITPNSAPLGQQNLTVAIVGQTTHFVQNTSVLDLGPGVTINSLTVTDATHLTAVISVAANAAVAVRDVAVTTGSEFALLKAGFTVTGPPSISSITPNTGQLGQTNIPVTIVGQNTHFTNASLVDLGAGVTVSGVIATNSTHISAQITIAANATLGFRTLTVTTGTEVVTLTNGFGVNLAGNQPPVITIAPTWSLTLPGTLALTYTVTDDGLPLGGALTVSWSTISGPGTVGFSNQTPTSITAAFSQAGTYVLQISATDTLLTTTQNVTVTVTGSNPPPPTVTITSPTEGMEVTAPSNVVGSVASTALASWTLEMRMQDESVFRPFATGTAPVTSGTLGVFDPTLLLNGIALIQLRATDTAGQTSIAGPVSVVVTRNLKIGNFTVSFNDLSVPVAGLPIQVVRTYDSRNKLLGDFGVGWTLDLKTVQLSENGALGDNWTETSTGGAFPNYCVQAVSAHVVTVSFNDGTTYTFQPALNPQCQQLIPIQDQNIALTFTPTGITPPNATLAVLGGTQPYVSGSVPGPVALVGPDLISTFDADQYLLTLPDGRVLQISRASGLQIMTDPNGNTLTVTSSGITHSSGKSVSFQRDLSGRITQITDPAGNPMVYTYDLNGNLASVTDRGNNTTTFTYDGNHGLLTIVDPRGVQPIKNVYDNSGRLIQHIDAYGNTINYTHDLNTNQEIVTDRLGNVTVNEYDTDGNIVKVTDALGGITTRTYDSRDNLLSETNPLGKARTYTYDAQNNRLTETDPLGRTTTYTYNARNQVLTATDPLGHTTTNTYDGNGNLTSTKDAANQTTTYVYNALGLRTSMTDPAGSTTQYQYDASGNLTQQTDALGHITTYTYDANGNKLSETRTRTTASGQETLVTGYQYDKLNHLVQTTYADGTTSQIAYNNIGKQSATTDQLGRQTSYQYDLMGRLTQTTYPDGTSESSTYDAEGDRLTSVDRGGRTTAYLYDALKRLTKTMFADGAATGTVYDAAGQVTQVNDARGNATKYVYDDAGRRTQVIDALTHSTSFVYDAAGNQSSMTDANGNQTQYQYDALNRRTKVTYADNTFDTTAYDALGRTTAKTDQAGKTTQFQYDALGRLTQVTDAASQITSYAYDEVGNRISQTDAKSHTTTFAYDKLGRRTKRTLPLGMAETFTYNAAGNLVSKTDFNGKTTGYTYDSVNRLLTKVPDASLGEPTVTFTYTTTGQRASMGDVSGPTTYTYDLRDRLLTKVKPQGTLTYTWDVAGNLLAIRSSNTGGTSVNYAYDALNRLSTTTDNRLAAGVTTYTYDAAGNLSSYLYPNGVQHSYTYNSLNRLTNLAVGQGVTALASYAYTLGPSGNRTAVTELGGRQVNYTYDVLYRLTGETIAGGAVNGAIGYTYDAVGNRLTRTSTVAPVPAATYAYDNNDRLTTDTYDSNGNTIASGTNTYAYDFENHLKSMNGAGVTITSDGDGNRVVETAGGSTTTYLVDDRNLTGYAQVLEEVTGGVAQRVYTYGLNRISQSQASGTSFYGYDGHGNVRLLTDTTGAVTDRYDYDAFGNLISQTGSTPNVYLYSGEQLDPNVGFYYLRARYYKTDGGRFTSADPFLGSVFEPASLHKYAYAQNNPVDNSDPSGRLTLTEAVAVSAVVGILSSSITYVVTKSLPKAIAAGVVATAATFFFAAPSPVLLSTAGATGIFRAGPFIVTAGQLEHIFERHSFIEGFLNNASYFYPGEEVLSLIKAADAVAPLIRGGRLVYIVDAGTTIGFDAYQMGPTVFYTVVTDAIGQVITIFPGIPTRLIFP